ncbi:MAG: DUF599 domain-containing protein [Pseudomonadota bacterium]
MVLIGASLGVTWYIEYGPRRAETVSALMDQRRVDWMRRMRERDMRIFDAALLGSLQNGSAFFASAALLAIGGGVAMLGQVEKLAMIAKDLPIGLSQDRAVWEIKLLVLVAWLAVAFLKFAWAHRLYSYVIILMGATPNLGEKTEDNAADQAARVAKLAGLSFNRGLRALYFALAGLAWMLGPLPLLIATALVVRLIHRREFRSKTQETLATRLPN